LKILSLNAAFTIFKASLIIGVSGNFFIIVFLFRITDNVSGVCDGGVY
jgi:hypothetical protein